MKIILLKDMAKLGRKGEVKEVSDGFARNFLILRNLASPATPENVKKMDDDLKSKKNQKEDEHDKFHALRAALAERGIVVKKKAYKSGKLYAAISAKEILEALKKLGFPMPASLNEEMIKFDAPIKAAGSHEARVMGPKGESILVKIEVEKE